MDDGKGEGDNNNSVQFLFSFQLLNNRQKETPFSSSLGDTQKDTEKLVLLSREKNEKKER